MANLTHWMLCLAVVTTAMLRADADSEITDMNPRSGPYEGKTAVTVEGHNLQSSGPSVRCRFGEVEVDSISQGDSRVTCQAPMCPFGYSLPHEVPVSLSLDNGLSWVTSPLTFTYYNPPNVTSIEPSSGPTFGNTDITVYGNNFDETFEALSCKVGDGVVPGQRISENRMLCRTPNARAGAEMFFLVSGNGQDFHGGHVKFTYYIQPRLESLKPSAGPLHHNTDVIIGGSGFLELDGLSCRFGSTRTSADFVSKLQLNVVTPQEEVPKAVSVECTLNGQDYTHQDLQYVFYRQPHIFDIEPASGPLSGGTHVTLHGSHFMDLDGLICKFGSMLSEATYVSEAQVLCMVPTSMEQGPVLIDISLNYQDFSQDGVQYLYYSVPTITSLSPSCGPLHGGTVVTVHGDNFVDTEGTDLKCRFGSEVVDAFFIDSQTITCTSPVSAHPGDTDFEVSLNEAFFTTSSVSFHYYNAPTVKSVDPKYGPLQGGTTIRLEGDNFPQQHCACLCRFETEVTHGDYLDHNTVRCEAPKSHSDHGHEVFVEVSFNGVDFTSSHVEFEYFEHPTHLTISPSSGPTDGGTKVTVIGAGLVATSKRDVWCQFGNLSPIRAHRMSLEEIWCKTPASVAGVVGFSISLNSQDYVQVEGEDFLYFPPPSVTSINPIQGPVEGTNPVTVYGKDFLELDSIRCRFGDEEVVGEFIDVHSVKCLAPAHSGDDVAVEVSLNDGADYTSSHVTYSYVDKPMVTSLTPALGPVSGGTEISVHGFGFGKLGTAATTCRFGEHVEVTGTRHGNTLITCSAPALDPGMYVLEVSVDSKKTFTANHVKFTAYEEPVVSSLSPMCGPEQGKSQLTITGTGFISNEQLSCKFIEVATGREVVHHATRGSTTTTVCETPKHHIGDHQVEVSNNGQDFTTSRLIFHFYANPVVHAIEPGCGPIVGGHEVFVKGQNFTNNPMCPPTCSFGTHETPANVLDSTTLRCLAPRVNHTADVQVGISFNGQNYQVPTAATFTYYQNPDIRRIGPYNGPSTGGSVVSLEGTGLHYRGCNMHCRFGGDVVSAVWISDSEVACITPAHPVGDVVLSFTLNGKHYIEAPSTYSFYEPPVLDALSISGGDVNGGTVVVISGNHFTDHAGLRCRFGEKDVRAVYVDEGHIKCSAPPVTEPRDVTVEVTLNSLDYTNAKLPFHYYAIEQVVPRSGPMTGGTTVTVKGGGFFESGQNTMCKFGNQEVAGRVLHDHTIHCDSPGESAAILGDGTKVPIYISLNGRDYTEVPGGFTYYLPPLVTSVVPRAIPHRGGRVVTLNGDNFKAYGDQVRCRFGTHTVVAEYIDKNELNCLAPDISTLESGRVNVEVSLNNQDFTNEGVNIYYYALESIDPPGGPFNETTTITLTGKGFVRDAQPKCRFGTEVYDAHYVSSEVITCTVPRRKARSDETRVEWAEMSMDGIIYTESNLTYTWYNPPTLVRDAGLDMVTPTSGPRDGGTDVAVFVSHLVTFGAQGGKQSTDAATHAACFFGETRVAALAATSGGFSFLSCKAPPFNSVNQEGDVRLAISMNGHHQISTDRSFHYYRQPVVASVSPISAFMSAETVVTVFGTDFEPSNDGLLRCRFGGVETIGFYHDPLTITCVAPISEGAGPVNVEVSLNGQDYTSEGVQFTYFSQPEALESRAKVALKVVLIILAVLIGVIFIAILGVRYFRSQESAKSQGERKFVGLHETKSPNKSGVEMSGRGSSVKRAPTNNVRV